MCYSYGKKPNTEFFLDYGFINANNQADNTFIMVFYLHPKDENRMAKANLVNDNRDWDRFRISTDFERDQMKMMFSWCRFVMSDDIDSMVMDKTRIV